MSYNPYKKYTTHWWRFWLRLPDDIFRFLVRVYTYLPLLWEDRDWDYNYLLRLMRLKIRRMRGSMDVDYHGVHGADRVAEMTKAEVLLRNVIEEDPDDEWERHWNLWHASLKNFKDCKNQKEHRRAAELSAVRQEKNWGILWQYLAKHAQGWWD